MITRRTTVRAVWVAAGLMTLSDLARAMEVGAGTALAQTLRWSAAALVGLLLLQALLALGGYLTRLAFQQRHLRDSARHWQRLADQGLGNATAEGGAGAAWNGVRKFEVVRKLDEGGNICSFYLQPHDKKPLPAFRPGQYLTFQLNIPGQRKPVVRCYSLSDCPGYDYYRVTIKKLGPPRRTPDAPPGLSSSYFHEQVRDGDYLDVRAPAGHFFLDTDRDSPVVLIGAGVGVTPVLSMLNHIAVTGMKRETWFFYGVRHGGEHILRDHFKTLVREHDNIRVQVVYSDPRDTDAEGADYHQKGRIGVELFKRMLPSNNYDFYICGPPPMIQSVCGQLQDWGVPEPNIHFEAFGPASVQKKPDTVSQGQPAGPTEISFHRSGARLEWTPERGSILDLAEASGVHLDSGCRAGNCGTCLTAIRAGEVDYLQPPGLPPEEGSCLACIAVPKGRLELDA